MADLTARPAGSGDRSQSSDRAAAAEPARHEPEPTIDVRAVRARTAPASTMGEEQPIRLSPPPDPLRMTNPSVGVGLLGGTVMAEEGATAGVLAQRQLLLDGEPVELGLRALGGGRRLLTEPAGPARVVLEPARVVDGGARRREVLVDGFRFEVDVEPERIASLRERASRGRAAGGHSGTLEVRAIIPGKVVAVSVEAGDEVLAGQQLLVVEAMKMQNELRAPRDGSIERIAVAHGANIEVGDLLVVIS